MHMSDYVEHLDKVLSSTGEKLLENAGSVSHKQAVDKALDEYRKYQVLTLSPVEKAYLEVAEDLPFECMGFLEGWKSHSLWKC